MEIIAHKDSYIYSCPFILRGDIKLKVIFQKILAVLLSFIVCVSFLSFAVFASDYDINKDTQTIIQGVKSVLNGAQQYFNGEITADEFNTHFSADMGRIGIAGFDIMSCGGFSEFVKSVCGSSVLGDLGIRDYFTDYAQNHGGGSESGRREFDMKGSTSALVCYSSDGSISFSYYSRFPGRITSRTTTSLSCNINYFIRFESWTGNGYEFVDGTYGSTLDLTSPYFYYKFYGDWLEGDTVSNIVTPNPVIPPTIEDPQDIDLVEFLNDFLNKLNFEYPDLSSIEGLLTSILNKLGTLDSDNDTEILSQIYIAIQSLNNDSHDNSEIITLLQDIRDNISSGGEASDLTELTNELKDITKTLKYIAGIETIDVVTDSIDFSTIEFSPTETKFFDKYGQLINLIISKFGYGPVDVLIKSCQSLIFNTSAPGDLTFNYKGTEYTVLSTSMFEDDSVKQSLSLVKSFLSVIILLGWLLVMRKRIVNSE